MMSVSARNLSIHWTFVSAQNSQIVESIQGVCISLFRRLKKLQKLTCGVAMFVRFCPKSQRCPNSCPKQGYCLHIFHLLWKALKRDQGECLSSFPCFEHISYSKKGFKHDMSVYICPKSSKTFKLGM